MPRKKSEPIATANPVAASPDEPTPLAATKKKPRGKAAVEAVVGAVVAAVRSRRKPVPTAKDAPVVPDPTATPIAKPARRRKKALVPALEPSAQETTETEFDDDGFPRPVWRPRQAASASSVAIATEESELVPRKSRRRGRREKPDGPIAPVAADIDVELPVPEITVKPVNSALPTRPAIETPIDAPQVVLRDGIPTLVREGRVYPPVFFFGSASDEKRADTVLAEAKLAGEAGVHLHSHLIEFDVDPQTVDASAGLAAFMLAKTLEVDPEAQVMFRIVFQAPRGWQKDYPEAKFTLTDGTIGEPSVCDDKFWNVARECLETFTKKIRLLEGKDHILGLHLERGEWFLAQGSGYDTSDSARRKFREWARMRYLDEEVTLRASWFDGTVRFGDIQIPEYDRGLGADEKFMRSGRKERRQVDYHLFLSDATVQRIGDLAYAAKQASEGYFLIGVSYGYTFEWSHPASGHLSLGKLLRTPEVDLIAGPPSYKTRMPGGTAAFPGPIDSFALNGKLYVSEEDFKTKRTHGGGEPDDDFNPEIKTPQALESMHWRGAGAAIAHGSGVSWMDLWGNGWLNTVPIWQRGAKVMESLITRMGAPLGDPDVLVFIDERALAYLVDETAFDLLVQSVRESVLRAGLNAGFYLLSDLAHREKFPEGKLYVFLNAWDVRPELRAAIKSRLQRDNKVLFWLYSAALFDAGRDSLERAREVTGIALKPQPFHSKTGTTILNRRHPLCEAFPDRGLVGGSQLEPSYFAIPENATVLGEYTQTGLPSFVMREFDEDPDPKQRWKSVFLGEPVVTPALMRTLGQMAGAHVYNFHEDVVHARPPFLTVHCTGTGPRAITLPSKWAAFNLLADQWVTVDGTSLRFNAADGSTHVFAVGPQEELEQLLAVDRTTLLRMDELPPKPENTLGTDVDGFDVPIMKLGDWMEGGLSDDLGEDWLLRPQVPDEDTSEDNDVSEDSDRSGRRRRRRPRRGSERDEPQPRGQNTTRTVSDTGDLEMNVLFRKRE